MFQLMFHRADIWRPEMKQATAQAIDKYNLVNEDVPCFIQPADSKEAFYYEQRGLENTHTIYTTSKNTFQRNDIFERNGEQFHVVGIKNGLYFGLYQELAVAAYPEDAKKRLSRESYDV